MFLLKCWRFPLVWFIWGYLSLQGVYCALYLSNNPTKNQVLLGLANEEATAHSLRKQYHSVETTGYGCWKLRGLQFNDHLCIRLRCDSDGLSVFILKEVGFSDSSGPNSTPDCNFRVLKGTMVKFVKICMWLVTKGLLISCAMHIKMRLIAHQMVVR